MAVSPRVPALAVRFACPAVAKGGALRLGAVTRSLSSSTVRLHVPSHLPPCRLWHQHRRIASRCTLRALRPDGGLPWAEPMHHIDGAPAVMTATVSGAHRAPHKATDFGMHTCAAGLGPQNPRQPPSLGHTRGDTRRW